MSHLLYLHSFKVESFVRVFGGGDVALVDKLLASGATARIRELLTNAIVTGLEWPTSDVDRSWIEAAVGRAITSRSFGVGAKPISPMGAGGALFDDHAVQFEEAGPTAKKLFAILQRGRNHDDGCFLLSRQDVVLAAKILKRVSEDDEDFAAELVEPFAVAAKQGRAIYGRWG